MQADAAAEMVIVRRCCIRNEFAFKVKTRRGHAEYIHCAALFSVGGAGSLSDGACSNIGFVDCDRKAEMVVLHSIGGIYRSIQLPAAAFLFINPYIS